MRPDNRFDRLESDIVDALRRAPSATPSADLDARILARAHAAVSTPKRRPQPIWFSMAAGLVVLVGSGLALRIWQQLEHTPSALDMPAAKVSAPAKATPDQDGSAAGPSANASAEPAPVSAQERQQEPAASHLEDKRDASALAGPVAGGPAANEPSLQKAHESSAASASKLEAATGITATTAIAEEMSDAPDMAAARPFPTEPAAVVASAPAAAPPVEQAPAREVHPETPATPPAVMAAQPAAAPAPAPPAAIADELGVLDITEPQAQPGADSEKVASFATGAAASGSAAFAQRDRAEEADQAAAASGAGRVDAYTAGLAALRKALAASDETEARRLLAQLRREFPDRDLPEDLRSWADRPQ